MLFNWCIWVLTALHDFNPDLLLTDFIIVSPQSLRVVLDPLPLLLVDFVYALQNFRAFLCNVVLIFQVLLHLTELLDVASCISNLVCDANHYIYHSVVL